MGLVSLTERSAEDYAVTTNPFLYYTTEQIRIQSCPMYCLLPADDCSVISVTTVSDLVIAASRAFVIRENFSR